MPLRILLARHGESVDNVRLLYAGSRDSPLTNHGVLQAQRLGASLAARSATIGPLKHIFASDLKRALKTAQTIAEAQSTLEGVEKPLEVVQAPELREKDFGSEEGKRFGTRGKQDARAADWVEPESQSSMKIRIERFVDAYFVPTVLETVAEPGPTLIVIVAHGIILNVLLRTLLTRYGPNEIAKLAKPNDDAPWRSEWLASWSNTGYLEADVRVAMASTIPDATLAPDIDTRSSVDFPTGSDFLAKDYTSNSAPSQNKGQHSTTYSPKEPPTPTPGNIQLAVIAVNCTEHLQGLKKTRGGLGSLGHDEKQRTVDSFFSRPAKKPKREEGDG